MAILENFPSCQKHQYDVMPTASASNVGDIVQYIGITGTYTNGYFYKCSEVSTNTYDWVNVDVQDGTVSRDLTVAQYDALSEAEKMDGTVYYVMDARPFDMDNAAMGFTPVGTVISIMGVTPPKNYLACNGQIVNIVDFPELASYFESQFGACDKFGGDGVDTFAIPDLRGEFLRGTGTNSHSKGGSGSTVGTHQDPTLINPGWVNSNNGGFSYPQAESTTYHSLLDYQGQDTYVVNDGNRKTYMISTEMKAKAVPSGDSSGSARFSTRPTNTSVLYCIATKNIYVDVRYQYDTNEQVVGTWLDNKPIYQKTIIMNNIPIGNNSTYSHGISNIDNIISFNYCMNNKNDTFFYGDSVIVYNNSFTSSPTSGSVITNTFTVDKTNINVWGSNEWNAFSDRFWYFTIRYTKTTD